MSKNKVDFSKGIYDARQLGTPRMLLLGFQHMFAMFGATVLVPLITGLDIATTLLMAGLGTLLFHVFTKFKVPAFLGSSFAFLGGYATVAPKLPDANGELTIANTEMLPYACVGVACAGLLYLVLATIIKIIGINKVMRFFPPGVTGPIIVAIGLGLAPTAISNCKNNWWLALIALGIVIVVNVFGKGMAKIIPILIGILGAYAVAGIVGNGFGVDSFAIDFSSVKEAAWVGLPIHWSSTVFGGVHDTGKAVTAIIAIMPIALATMMEHIGDISAISATVGENFIEKPGLHRTLVGDGVATARAGLFGGYYFNAANILLSAAIAICGLSVAFPVGIGLALVLGVLVNYFGAAKGEPTYIFIGVALITVAIILNGLAYKKALVGTKKVSGKGILISVVAGVIMAFFYRFVAASMDMENFASPAPGKLTPYTAVFVFAIGVFVSNFLFNTLAMKHPVEGKPVSISGYFKGDMSTHLVGVLGGVMWCIGQSFSMIASEKAGAAISYGLGQGATLVSALWGILIWKEFKGAPAISNRLNVGMFILFVIGLGFLIYAGA